MRVWMVSAGALLITLAVITSVFSITSPDRMYNVTPGALYLNWTNSYLANITIATNASNNYTFVLGVDNETTGITGHYSQRGLFLSGKYVTTGENTSCFNAADSMFDSPLKVRNQTGNYLNVTSALLNGTNTTLTLIHSVVCPPGKYYGNVTITNVTNSTGSVNLTVTIDVPISTDNELSASTGIGMFKGTLEANASTYHSYYFNTSNITNSTGVTINLSWTSAGKDIDLFLFDGSGDLKAKSIEKNVSSEQLNYNYLPPGEMWEIRLFANLSSSESYTGHVYFTTLNVTNSSSNASLEVINLGSVIVGQSSMMNITLRNEGGINFTNITETQEVYHLDGYNSNISKNFTFVIPATATRIRSSVNWSGAANYTIALYNSSGIQMGNSTDKHINANVTGAMQEEFVETADVSEGVWRVEVFNNSNVTGNYTVSLKFWIPSAGIANSTYTTASLNMSGLDNYTKGFSLNATAPNTSVSGLYKGILKYEDSGGSIVQVAFRMNVTAAVLLVNNTLNSQTVTVKDNIGFNRSGSDLQIRLPINNTGSQDIVFEQTANSTNLSKGAYGINFSYSYPSRINASQNGTLEINLTYNTNMTGNSQGIYTGWIYLNATEAYPYRGFNLTVRVNLTDDLIVNISQIKTEDGDDEMENVSRAENVTLLVKVTYINGSHIGNDLNKSNFTVWLKEGNVSESVYRIPSSGYLTNYENPGFLTGTTYYLNVTVPANMVGGRYFVNINTTVKRNEASLLGLGDGYPLIINETGLYLSSVSSTSFGTVNEGSSYYYNATVSNYGPVTASNAVITFNKGSCPITVSSYQTSCSPATLNSPSAGSATFTLSGNNSQGCWLRWKITGNNVSADTSCSYMNITVDKPSFNNITGISLTIDDADAGGGSTSSGDTTSTGTCSTNSDCDSDYYCSSDGVCTRLSCAGDEKIVSHACVKMDIEPNVTSYKPLIYVSLGGSNTTSVSVKNNGERTDTIKLNVSIDGGINYSATPISCSLVPAESCTFNVTFNVSGSARLGNHTGTLKAYSGKYTAYFDKKTFRIFVKSTEERELEIKAAFQNYTERFGELEKQLNGLAATGIFPEANLSNSRLLINESKSLITNIQNAINGSDYPTAESLLDELNSTLTDLKRRIDELNKEQEKLGALAWGNISYLAVGIVAAVIAIGFVVYLLLPPKGYDVKRGGYTHREATVGERVERTLEDIKERLTRLIKRDEEGRKGYKYR